MKTVHWLVFLLVATGLGCRTMLEKTNEFTPEESHEKTSPFQKTFMTFEEASKAMMVREPSAPKVGDPAPDIELADPSGDRTIRLSDFRGKSPVVLLFGSYT